MEAPIKDWFNENILNPDMYMWSIQTLVTVCVIILFCVIISKCIKCLTISLIAKGFLELTKIVVSAGICLYIFLICSLNKLSIATLFVVLLAIIQILDSIISISEIVKKILSNPEK